MRARDRWPAILAFPLAALVALASLGGIAWPSTYARETASWAAQGVGQDWVDLLVLVPLLVVAGAGALRGSRAFLLLLAGALVYSLYSFVLYAFEVHFNSLFLVYCAALGVSFFSLAGVVAGALREDVRSWYEEGAPVKLAGGLLVLLALAFAALWLSEVVPALARGVVPASVAEVGSFTNPVHVLDFSIVLPAMCIAGVALLRRSALGYFLGPVMLTFNIVMPLAIAGMIASMRMRGVHVELAPLGIFGATVLASVASLVRLLRRLRPTSLPG